MLFGHLVEICSILSGSSRGSDAELLAAEANVAGIVEVLDNAAGFGVMFDERRSLRCAIRELLEWTARSALHRQARYVSWSSIAGVPTRTTPEQLARAACWLTSRN